MQIGKGDVPGQRRRRRARYRGCRVCGVRGVHCTECGLGAQIVATHGGVHLALVVDGSYVAAGKDAPRVHSERYAKLRAQIADAHPDWTTVRVDEALVEALTGGPRTAELGHGGAGLVLVRGDEVLASRACGFRSPNSSDAELQAVVRGARWAPDVAIYTDQRDLPVKLSGINPRLVVNYLDPNDRSDAYAIAHRLSVEGRCREAPETIPAVGLAFALERSQISKGERKRRAVDLLLESARRDPAFDGDFTALADRLGWNAGKRWRENPAIRIATERWAEGRAEQENPG